MTLPSTGSISFSQIQDEFGLPPSKNLGAYRISQSVGSLNNLPLDTEIPQSGSISFSNFRGKKLNIVVDYHSESIEGSHRSGNYKIEYNARGRYNENGVAVIGGFRTRPSNSSGTKVYVNVNRGIGSEISSDSTRVALRTGGWDEGTELIIVIGPSGRLYGAGGNGGRGQGVSSTLSFGLSPSDYEITSGSTGTSALGIEYNGTKIINNGVIRCGFGGGGASRAIFVRGGVGPGGAASGGVGGNGGGGGSGYPAGGGGPGGGVFFGTAAYQPGNSGSDGDINNGGFGGARKGTYYGYTTGQGGRGGGDNGAATDGEAGLICYSYGCYYETSGGSILGLGGAFSSLARPGSSAGTNGYAIVRPSGVSYTLEGNSLIGEVLTADPT